MSSAKTGQNQGSACNDTQRVPSQPKFLHAVMKTGKIIVFFITFGMVYPHVFTDEE